METRTAIAATAVIVSLASLAASIYAAKDTRRQNHLAHEPVLQSSAAGESALVTYVNADRVSCDDARDACTCGVQKNASTGVSPIAHSVSVQTKPSEAVSLGNVAKSGRREPDYTELDDGHKDRSAAECRLFFRTGSSIWAILST